MTDPDRPIEDVLARFQELLAHSEAPAAPDDDTRNARLAFLRAASVLHLFSLVDLRPDDGRWPSGSAARYLLDDTVPAVGWGAEGLRTLGIEARREGLAMLGSRSAIGKALKANPNRQRTDVQSMLERWAGGETLRPAAMSVAELRAAATLCEWGLPDFLPRQIVDEFSRRRSAVSNFEVLAEGFVGRTTELEQLRKFVGLTPSSFIDRARDFVFGRTVTPLVLFGVGGAGKTALVARFILDFFSNSSAGCFPFMYLAFDDETLDPAEPATIIGAAVRQIELQSGEIEAGDADYQGALLRMTDQLGIYFSTRQRLSGSAVSARSQRERIHELLLLDEKLFVTFARFLDQWSKLAGGRIGVERLPILFVLDTFEEVEFLPDTDLERFWELVDVLRQVPEMRLLIVGRSMPNSAYLAGRVQQLALGDLNRADALELLQRLGVDQASAAYVADHFGTNPLTLRLAARLLRESDGISEIQGVRSQHDGRLQLGAEVIRGQLYRRVLDHIHDPRIRALAHPGMVLRRVTAAIIQEVLAPHCGFGWIDAAESEQLFASLAREHSLVRRDEYGALLYREEVRRPMLALLAADRPDLTRELHRAAARFYAVGSDEASAGEEIYHRLMLGDLEHRVLQRRWTNSIGQRLAAAAEELPPESRAWLASRTRLRLSDAERELAGAAERERIVGHEAVRAFRIGDFESALNMLRNVNPAPDSPLAALHARALLALGQPDLASAVLNEYLATFPPLASSPRLAELLWLAAQSCAQRGDRAEAARWLEQLVPIAKSLPSRLPLLQTLTEQLAILEPGTAGPSRQALAGLLMELDPSETYREAALIRLAMARLGPSPAGPWTRFGPDLAYELLSAVPSWTKEQLAEARAGLASALETASSPQLEGAITLLDPESSDEDTAKKIATTISMAAAEFSHSRLSDDVVDPAAIQALWTIFKAERATLAAATLAGIGQGEENWLRSGSSFEALA
ncbi:MAG TPA: hypothetical protein VIT38_12760 [Allosphingosinicella sp.]